MDRFTEATYRIDSLLQVLEEAGFNLNDPWTYEHIVVPDNIRFATGATRLVVWDEEATDYVMKIALDEDYEEYCVKEVELYRAAVEAGLEDHFAWCEEIHDYGTKSVYAMEYLDCDGDEIDSESYEWGYERYCTEQDLEVNSSDSRERFDDYYWSRLHEDLVLDWLEDKLVQPVAAKLDRFITDNNINDIHAMNLGYRGTQLVLCDYAGFGW